MNAVEIRNPVISDSDLFVIDRIYIRISTRSIFLSADNIEQYLVRAIRELADAIVRKLDVEDVCFDILDVESNMTCFRNEALYIVMRAWLSEHYDFDLPPIAVDVDLRNGKFTFDV